MTNWRPIVRNHLHLPKHKVACTVAIKCHHLWWIHPTALLILAWSLDGLFLLVWSILQTGAAVMQCNYFFSCPSSIVYLWLHRCGAAIDPHWEALLFMVQILPDILPHLHRVGCNGRCENESYVCQWFPHHHLSTISKPSTQISQAEHHRRSSFVTDFPRTTVAVLPS